MRTFNLHFEGSILDENRSSLPTYSGIYIVYRGVLFPNVKMVRCDQILYIGQSNDIRRRLSVHDKRTEFLKYVKEGEVLFYSYAKADRDDLDRIENALIYNHKPPLNDHGKDSFLYPSTEVVSDGECACLDKDIIITATQRVDPA